MTAARPYLLIARVGRHSLHRRWLGNGGRQRGFDVLLSYYDADTPVSAAEGVHIEHRPGTKVGGIGALLAEHAVRIGGYRHVAIFDDDLDIDAAGIHRLFALADRHGFLVCQPALSHDSFFTFAGLLSNPGYEFRSTTFVEMMCPCFRNDMLPAVRAIYTMGYESGLDLLWCNLLGQAPGRYAVIDAVSVRHTRPVGGQRHANGFTGGARYEEHIHAVLARFALPWLPCVPYFGRRRDGRLVRGRLALLLSSLRIAAAVPRRGGGLRRLTAVLIHWKHLLLHRPRNLRVEQLGHLAAHVDIGDRPVRPSDRLRAGMVPRA